MKRLLKAVAIIALFGLGLKLSIAYIDRQIERATSKKPCIHVHMPDLSIMEYCGRLVECRSLRDDPDSMFCQLNPDK